MDVQTSFWCERVRTCFHMFSQDPSTLQHLLLFGPPGSGKTTSASWLVDQIWGSRKQLMCMSMNAADERSLESIRQKVFPFLHADWRNDDERAPRFLILDECETLTEAAQLSLQTMLNMNPQDLCVILICNSQSRIHPKLRQRLLKVRYDPPHRKEVHTDLFTVVTRGDLRLHGRRQEMETRIWKYIHCHPSEVRDLLREESADEQMILTELLLLADYFQLMDRAFIDRLHLLYPLLMDGALYPEDKEEKLVAWICEFKEKFDEKGATSIKRTDSNGCCI